MSAETYVFIARLSHVGGGKPGIYIPKELWIDLEKHIGKKVIIHIYIPKHSI